MIEKAFAKLVVLAATLFLAGCGQPVEQNKMCLVLHSLGDRTIESKDGEVGNNFRAELITAQRAPINRPGVVLLFFDLGLQYYEFTADASFESPTNEEFVIDCLGGKVRFDVSVQLHIMRELPDLKERLIRLMKDYQLRRFDGEENVLGQLVGDRFQRLLREPLQDHCASRNPIDVMRNKKQINALLTAYLNELFEPYGVKIAAVGITSAVRLDQEQQNRMSEIVQKNYKMKALELERGKPEKGITGLKDLELSIGTVRQEALTSVETITNTARAGVVTLVSEAYKERRATFIDMIGQESYVKIEALLLMAKSLESGGMTISIVPDNSNIWLSPTAAGLNHINK